MFDFYLLKEILFRFYYNKIDENKWNFVPK